MSAADVTTEAARPAAAGARARSARLWPRGNPWRHPWFLEGFTWLYLIWSLVPIAIAVLFSFNNGRSQSASFAENTAPPCVDLHVGVALCRVVNIWQ